MQNKIKSTNIHNTKFAQHTVRCVFNKGKKLLFVSDLVDIYGRGFVEKAKNSIQKERIKDSKTNNSQSRRLITSTDARQFLCASSKSI